MEIALKTAKLGDVEECFEGLGHDCVVDVVLVEVIVLCTTC